MSDPTMAAPGDGIDMDSVHAHGAAGSRTAMKILLTLAQWKLPCSNVDLSNMTGLTVPVIKQGLQGLKDRRMVVPEGHGQGTRWHLTHLAPAALRHKPEPAPEPQADAATQDEAAAS